MSNPVNQPISRAAAGVSLNWMLTSFSFFGFFKTITGYLGSSFNASASDIHAHKDAPLECASESIGMVPSTTPFPRSTIAIDLPSGAIDKLNALDLESEKLRWHQKDKLSELSPTKKYEFFNSCVSRVSLLQVKRAEVKQLVEEAGTPIAWLLDLLEKDPVEFELITKFAKNAVDLKQKFNRSLTELSKPGLILQGYRQLSVFADYYGFDAIFNQPEHILALLVRNPISAHITTSSGFKLGSLLENESKEKCTLLLTCPRAARRLIREKVATPDELLQLSVESLRAVLENPYQLSVLVKERKGTGIAALSPEDYQMTARYGAKQRKLKDRAEAAGIDFSTTSPRLFAQSATAAAIASSQNTSNNVSMCKKA